MPRLSDFCSSAAFVASVEQRLDEALHLGGRTFATILGRIELDSAVEDTGWQIATAGHQQRSTP